MSIEFKNVSKKLGNNIVINNVNIEIKKGIVTGLKGINGSGKTMMMRLIAGLIYATKGEVVIDGKVLGKDISFPPSIGLMLENPAFLPGYNGFDNLKMLASIKGEIKDEKIDEVLETVGLANIDKKYRKYSLGMKQRLGIAAAIMEEPDIILLDEPTNSLDASGQEMVREIVAREKERGATVILSCHDSALLESMCDEIFNIEVGEITSHYEPEKEQVSV
ncbi:MAG: ATP-binding cassette domain-containing protein [Ruminococcaceae bacterium]|nr:ATP-binding cassette domain-containing protein [Oscillospiraceae bacterium]